MLIARLKLTVWIIGAIPGICILPAVLLKIAGAAVPKLFAVLASVGMATVPVPITLFLVYFNLVWGTWLDEAVRRRSLVGIVRTSCVLCLGNSLLIYVLIRAIKVFWLG